MHAHMRCISPLYLLALNAKLRFKLRVNLCLEIFHLLFILILCRNLVGFEKDGLEEWITVGDERKK